MVLQVWWGGAQVVCIEPWPQTKKTPLESVPNNEPVLISGLTNTLLPKLAVVFTYINQHFCGTTSLVKAVITAKGGSTPNSLWMEAQ